jgi:hypothetical protein
MFAKSWPSPAVCPASMPRFLGDEFSVIDKVVEERATVSVVYTIVLEKTGYEPSEVYPAYSQPISPALGGGLEKIVPDDVPGQTTPRTYYMSLRVQFTPGKVPPCWTRSRRCCCSARLCGSKWVCIWQRMPIGPAI